MKMQICLILSVLSFQATAAPLKKPADKDPAKNNMAFDSQLVEGQIYRPDLSVVTGDTRLDGFGVLRLRANFSDHMSEELGEDAR